MNRRHLTPTLGTPIPGVQPTRRASGARHPVSYRILFFEAERQYTGWALNISRGGFRAVVEVRVPLGTELAVQIADEVVQRQAKVVWTQEERDGTIVGLEFFDPLTESRFIADGVEAMPTGVELADLLEGEEKP